MHNIKKLTNNRICMSFVNPGSVSNVDKVRKKTS